MTDIKVFILFLLNNIGYPIDHTSVIGMVSENTEELLIDYDECLRELSEETELEADYVATGHYAHVVRLDSGRYTVKTARHAAKDQTYQKLAGEAEQRNSEHEDTPMEVLSSGMYPIPGEVMASGEDN